LCGASHHLKPFCFFCHLKEPFLNLLFIGSKLYNMEEEFIRANLKDRQGLIVQWSSLESSNEIKI
jgi:hypothetical protein